MKRIEARKERSLKTFFAKDLPRATWRMVVPFTEMGDSKEEQVAENN